MIGLAFYSAMNEKWERALEYARTFLKIKGRENAGRLSEYLLSKQTEQFLSEKAGESPENLVTWHTALGFWAEGTGDKKKAVKHYKEALGSYMDTMIEYDFAKERIKWLRKSSE